MTSIRHIDHIAIIVDDIDAALHFWRDALGLRLSHVEDVPDQEAIVAFLPAGDSEVELVKPTTDNSGVARYLLKRGPGVHHICFQVDNIDDMLQVLKTKGVRLVNETPMIGTAGKKIAFIHPESTHGVLVELYELTQLEPQIRMERVASFRNRVLTGGQVMGAAAIAFLRALRQTDGNREKKETPTLEDTF